MNAKDEMKQVRNWLRGQVKSIQSDPYLESVAARVSARIVKWDAKGHRVLVCLRDLSKPETPYNSISTRWLWVTTYCGKYSSFKWNIWRELNDLVVNMQHPDRLPF